MSETDEQEKKPEGEAPAGDAAEKTPPEAAGTTAPETPGPAAADEAAGDAAPKRGEDESKAEPPSSD